MNRKFLTNRKGIVDKINDISKKGIRVLCFAVSYNNDIYALLGFAYIKDEIRKEAIEGIKLVKSANIRTIMITGDHIATAKAIAEDLGILKLRDLAITGSELDKIPQKELEKNIMNYSVFARVSPEHKVRIVKAFQKTGAVVAMTGDGVNDAPALKNADIGIAMGKNRN